MPSLARLAAGFVPFTPYAYQGRMEGCCLCGSQAKLPLSAHDRRLKRLTTVICAGCGLIRTDPMPTEAELADYYRHHYRADYQLVGTRPPRRHLVRTRAEAARRVALLGLPPGARVLDYGSGSGEFLEAGTQAGWHMEGVEPGEAYSTHARGQGAVVHARLPADAGPFDAITAHHVFEHLRDPLAVLRQVNALGYGLTLGIQTRIDSRAQALAAAARVGNVYVNRNMIGAVVGVQPFGGEGLSGTGPKAGGPHYLLRFCAEQTVTINTTAAGGNATLLAGA